MAFDAEAWLAAIVESSTDAIVGKTMDGIVVSWNRGAERLFGYTAEEMIGRPIAVLAPPERRDEMPAILARIRKGERLETFATQRMRRDGQRVSISLTVSPIRDATGRIVGASKIARDISRQRELEAALDSSQERLRLAIEATGLGIWDWNVLTNEMIYSERAKAIFGFPQDGPLTLDDVRAATHPDDLPFTWAQARRALNPEIRAKEPYRYRIIRRDGAIRWVTAQGDAVFGVVDGTERALRYVGTIQDITDTVLAEHALRDAEATRRLAMQAAGLVVWDYDVKAERLAASRELKVLYGFPADAEVSIETLRARHHPDDAELFRKAGVEALARGDRQFGGEFRIIRSDGEERWVAARAEMFGPPGAMPTRVIGVISDITDRKRAEAELRDAMEAQELATRELSHRVKNTLQLVSSMLSLQAGRITDPAAREQFARARRRVEAVVQTHSALYPGTGQRVDALDFGDLLRGLCRSLQALVVEAETRISVSVDATSAQLPADTAIPLALIANELITNAVKYATDGSSRGKVRVGFTVDGDDQIRLTVEDDGPGLPEGQPSGGLGMDLVQAMTVQLGGTVAAENRPGGRARGLRVTVTVPRPADSP